MNRELLDRIEALEMHVLYLNAEIILCRNGADKLTIQKEQLNCLNKIEKLYKALINRQLITYNLN